MDPKKTDAVFSWPTLTSVQDIHAFLGFANFYSRFIQEYSKIAATLRNWTKNNCQCQWNLAAHDGFVVVKDSFTHAPAIRQFDPALACILKTNASDFVAAAALYQRNIEGMVHLVAFYYHKMTAAKCKYGIYNKEFLTIVWLFEQWRQYLEPASHGGAAYH